MDYLALANNHNTKVELSSLGPVELKYISGGDTIAFAKILSQEQTAKELVEHILFHQLVHPKMDFASFQKIPSSELDMLAKAFTKNEEYTFKHLPDTGDLYNDFVGALKTANRIDNESISLAITTVAKELNTFSKNYRPVLGESAQLIIDQAQQLQRDYLANAVKIGQSIQPAITQYQTYAKTLIDSVGGQIKAWQSWLTTNKGVLRETLSVWTRFQADYKIAEEDAASVLRKYKWFVSPSLPLPLIFEVQKLDKKPGRQNKAVNALFIEFFEADDCQNLVYMASRWQSNPYFKSRLKIINDCVTLTKIGNKSGVNTCNVILPSLIVQIDGILNDYMAAKNLNHMGYNNRNAVLQANPLPVALSPKLGDLASEVFLNILFQRSFPGIPLTTPFNFNRHKILHAENTRYGRKDYLVRAFMVLDLLASLS